MTSRRLHVDGVEATAAQAGSSIGSFRFDAAANEFAGVEIVREDFTAVRDFVLT